MTNEMAMGMVAPVIVCFGLVRLGICPLVPFLHWLTPKSVYPIAHDAMLIGMIVVMIYRRSMYAYVPELAMVHAHGTDGETRDKMLSLLPKAPQS
jgi:hypothetical protein